LASEGVFTIVSGCGFRLLVNDGDAHFTIDLDGSVTLAEQQGDAMYLAVDDLLVQVVHVSHAQLGAAGERKQGLDLLRAHEAWESAYLAGALHTKVEPREVQLESKGGGERAGQLTGQLTGIVWWFPLPDRAGADGVAIHRLWAYATVVVGDHVVGLSARAEGGLEPVDVMSRLARWVATIAPSATPLSPRAVSEALRGPADEKCPAPEGTLGIDRRLRLDEIPRGARDDVGRAAARLGGVERQTIKKRLRYRNHACRVEYTYPDGGWTDYLVRDFSDEGCMVNLATPLVVDGDTKEKITNAVVLTVAHVAPGFGADDLHAQMVDAVKRKGAEPKPAKRPLLEGALGATYAAEADGTHFVGEIATVRRGDLLYCVHFNSTRGTLAEGRKHLQRWLAGLRLDVD
jgi:hypothetical protein